MKTIVPAILAFVLFVITNTAISINTPNLFAFMERKPEVRLMLQKLIDDGTSPTVQYVIFIEDSILHKFQKGWADAGNNRSVVDRTTYNAYSVTKTFTALAVLQLAEQRKLDIEEPVIRYLPDFPYGSEITVRNLVSAFFRHFEPNSPELYSPGRRP